MPLASTQKGAEVAITKCHTLSDVFKGGETNSIRSVSRVALNEVRNESGRSLKHQDFKARFFEACFFEARFK
jgi:hypothetical protein